MCCILKPLRNRITSLRAAYMEHCRACEILPVTRLQQDLSHQSLCEEGRTSLLEQTNLFPQLWSAGFPLCHFPPVWGPRLFSVRFLRLPWFSDALSWGLQKRAGPCFCSTGASEGFPTAPKGHCVTFICLIYPLETSVLA